MPVTVNFKICDNSPECNGAAACPTKAFHFDVDKETLAFDESKCTGCGLCACCPAGAIHFARTEEEAKKIKEEIDKDPRKVSDLFVNRYGAQPVRDLFLIEENEFQSNVLDFPRSVMVEIIDEDSIECLIDSIPIKELLENLPRIKYRKIMLKELDLTERYKINKLPCLLFFHKGQIFGRIEGFYSIREKEKLIGMIAKILEKDPEKSKNRKSSKLLTG